MRLVIVVDVDGDHPDRDPHAWAEPMLARLEMGQLGARFVRAEWEDTVRREGGDVMIDDEDE